MLANYFKIAIRNIWRNKVFSLINVLGLSLGLAASILILLLVKFLLSYDKFHDKAGNIYQLYQELHLESRVFATEGTGGGFANVLTTHFPEVEKSLRIMKVGGLMMNYYDADTDTYKSFIENNVLAADSTFFDMLSFGVVRANKETLLKNPNSILLTSETAKKMFGAEDPIGKTIKINDRWSYTVEGVIEDAPENSTIKYDYVLPFSFLERQGYPLDGFEGDMFKTLLLLEEDTDIEALAGKIQEHFKEHADTKLSPRYYFVPFHNRILYGESRNIFALYIFAALGTMILLIACINFINLTTARSISRAKEVAVRKVNGARRRHLISQFMGETILITFISLNLAMVILERVLPFLNSSFNTNLGVDYGNVGFYFEMFVLIVVTGVLSGFYPAIVLSSFKPIKILRGTIKSGKSGGRFRKVLVVAQFTFTIISIMFTVMVARQFNYMVNTDLGFDKKDIVAIPMRGDINSKYQYIQDQLRGNPDIISITSGSEVPSFVQRGEIDWGSEQESKNQIARIIQCDHNFLETFNIELKKGQFYKNDTSDFNRNSIVVNEEIVEVMGWAEPIGKDFYFWGHNFKVIGVVDNIKFFPFDIGSMALILVHSPYNNLMFVKHAAGKQTEALADIEAVFMDVNKAYPFDYFFIDGSSIELLNNRRGMESLLLIFTLLSIVISSLGLLGLSIYTAQNKVKEIGIRKAMGATTNQIVKMVSRQFLKLVLISNIIALPLCYFVLDSLLQFFSYRTSLSWWIFILVMLSSMLLASLTIVQQAIKSAQTNPARTLKYE